MIVLLQPPYFRLLGSHNDRAPLELAYASRFLSDAGIEHVVVNADFVGSSQHLPWRALFENEAYFRAAVDGHHTALDECLELVMQYRPETVVIAAGDSCIPTKDFGSPYVAAQISKRLRKFHVKTIGIGPIFQKDHEPFDDWFDGFFLSMVNRSIVDVLLGDAPDVISGSPVGDLPLFDFVRPHAHATDYVMSNFGCSYNCVAEGGKIVTDRGQVFIENIRAGDLVLGCDSDGLVVWGEVSMAVETGFKPVLQIVCGDACVELTADHPVWTRRGWVDAGELRGDDEVCLLLDGISWLEKDTAVLQPQLRVEGYGVSRSEPEDASILGESEVDEGQKLPVVRESASCAEKILFNGLHESGPNERPGVCSPGIRGEARRQKPNEEPRSCCEERASTGQDRSVRSDARALGIRQDDSAPSFSGRKSRRLNAHESCESDEEPGSCLASRTKDPLEVQGSGVQDAMAPVSEHETERSGAESNRVHGHLGPAVSIRRRSEVLDRAMSVRKVSKPRLRTREGATAAGGVGARPLLASSRFDSRGADGLRTKGLELSPDFRGRTAGRTDGGQNPAFRSEWRRVGGIKTLGMKRVFDLTVEPNHNFFAGGLLVKNCSFCFAPLMVGGRVAFQPTGLFLRDVFERARILGRNKLYIADMIFPLNVRRLRNIAESLEGSGFTFNCESRTDTLREEVVGLLKKIGVTTVKVGLESMDDATLARMNKRQTLQKEEAALQMLKDSGLRVVGYLILGDFYSSVDAMWQTLARARDLQAKGLVHDWVVNVASHATLGWDERRFDAHFSLFGARRQGIPDDVLWEFLSLQEKREHPTLGVFNGLQVANS